ncbi:hypothetical protein EYF80_014969 [Liparis tanakae]|uniref:Uncharacterized protein n=1 Tax=Liparis tanakae TaxID=230148 RepID=A0A4Z2I9V9_9TELE|nr:hypothetical protein EYF80_014969 [Liparis tanakae]
MLKKIQYRLKEGSGHLLGTGTREVSGRGPCHPSRASPESGTALGIDTPDLLGDGASKLPDLPDHCTRCEDR